MKSLGRGRVRSAKIVFFAPERGGCELQTPEVGEDQAAESCDDSGIAEMAPGDGADAGGRFGGMKSLPAIDFLREDAGFEDSEVLVLDMRVVEG